MLCELRVADCFEIQSECPNEKAEQDDETGSGIGVALTETHWQRDHKHEGTLQSKDGVETHDGESLTMLAPHCAIPEVFTFA